MGGYPDNSIHELFLRELKSLLFKYGACLSTEDHWTGYPECGEDVRMTVEFPFPHGDLDLGKMIDGD